MSVKVLHSAEPRHVGQYGLKAPPAAAQPAGRPSLSAPVKMSRRKKPSARCGEAERSHVISQKSHGARHVWPRPRCSRTHQYPTSGPGSVCVKTANLLGDRRHVYGGFPHTDGTPVQVQGNPPYGVQAAALTIASSRK